MSKAYVKEIKQNSFDSHQTNPGAMLTCLRWDVRDVYNYDGDNFATRQPMVIYSDIIQLTTNNSKTVITPQMTAILKGGDINYSTALNPGDFVLVNIVNNDHYISSGDPGDDSLRNRAVNLKPINRYNDGFKGVYKVQTCRKQIKVDDNGKPSIFYVLHCYSATEFNTSIYYDPVIYGRFKGRYALFASQFDKFWGDIIVSKDNKNIQDTLRLLVKTLIGQGLSDVDFKLQPKPVNHFKIPSMLGPLIGRPNAKYASEIYNHIYGVWQKSIASGFIPPEQGFNQGITRIGGTNSCFYKCKHPLDGRKILEAEYWNNVKIWAILQNYLNPTINEMYTTFRISPEGYVMPTVIARQKPFTSLHFKADSNPVSRHLEMPRWKISANLIKDLDIGKDEAARVNFVQIYTRSLAVNDANNRAAQVGNQNWVADIRDIVRSGLRPYLSTANYDFPRDSSKRTKGKQWSRLVSDWLFGGHLRTGGTMVSVGIQEPISVGDNLELDDVVYHIESISDTFVIEPNGKKKFRTKIIMSFGTDIRSTNERPVYPEMQYTDFETMALDDYNHERLIFGWGEAQDTIGRDNGEETARTKEKDFTPGKPKRPMFEGNNSGEEEDPSDQ